MKDLSPLNIEQPVVGYPARLVEITRTDGTVIRIAESDEPLEVDGDTFDVVAGFQVSAVKHTANGEVPSCQFVGVIGDTFDSDEITFGLFDSATVQIYTVDRLNLSAKGLLFTGAISDISISHIQRQFSFSVKGPSASSRIVLTRKRSPMCQTDFGSVLCGVDIESYKAVTTVVSVASAFSFTVTGLAQADGYFNNGIVVTGSGQKFDIGQWTNSTQTVLAYLPCNHFLTAGDTVTLYKGCNKVLVSAGGCSGISNQLNFVGEPHFLGTAAAAQQV